MANILKRLFGGKATKKAKGKRGPNINENPVSSASQKAKILAYMMEGNSITPLEALERFQSFRLGARIADLKEDGWPIEIKWVVTNTGKRVKSYSLYPTDQTKIGK